MNKNILTKILFWFITSFLFVPSTYILFVVYNLGVEILIGILITSVFVTSGMILLVLVFFFIISKFFSFYMEQINLKEFKNTTAGTKFINNYPLYISVLSCIGNLFLTNFLAYLLDVRVGVFNSQIQFLYFISIGSIITFLSTLFTYYITKKKLFPLYKFLEYRPLTIFQKFTIPVSISVIGIITILMIILVREIYKNKIAEDTQTIKQASLESSRVVKSYIEKYLNEAEALAKMYASIKAGEENSFSRENSNFLLKNFIKKSENYIGIWTIFESNQFDKKDENYINKDGYGETGRYAVYWGLDKDGKIYSETPINYEVDGVGDFYLIPKKTKQSFLTEPYYASIKEEKVFSFQK